MRPPIKKARVRRRIKKARVRRPIKKARVSSHLTHSQSQDANNQRRAQAEPVMDGGDWRTHLPPGSRHRIVNKILDTLKRHLPGGLHEQRKTAVRFEEKIYSAATSQSDYLRKICLKMLTMETKSIYRL